MFRFQTTTSETLFTYMCLCHQYKQVLAKGGDFLRLGR